MKLRSIQAGTTLHEGRYTVLEPLEHAVFRCQAPTGFAVVKLFDQSEVAHPTELLRFHKEIETALSIRHPNLVEAYEFFREGDLLAYSMEYVPGGDLASLIGSTPEFPFDLALHFLLQISRGIKELHAHGIIHRDLKPENVLVTENLQAKISDFGFAHLFGAERLTRTGQFVGTVHYTPPEYFQSGELDFGSDIYSFGILGFRMLTNEFPFSGHTVTELIQKIQSAPPRSVRAFRPDCPLSLAALIEKAMTRNPKERFRSAEALNARLTEIAKELFPEE